MVLPPVWFRVLL